MKNLAISLSIFFLISSCVTVPYSQRKTLILISQDEEIALGGKTFEEMLKNVKLSEDKEKTELVKKVGQKIANVAEQQKYKWEFVLIEDSKTINAFCLPGGKVGFYTGILKLCPTEEDIAVVMSHEVAHAIARHGAERITQLMLINMGEDFISAAIKNKLPQAQKAILTAYGLGTTLGVILPFSRQNEYEADYIGLILMAKSGYNPQSAITFWERMLKFSSGKNIPEFLSTHPNDEKRIENIKKHLLEAMKYYQPQ
jgi:predicted Zn-dependent protease